MELNENRDLLQTVFDSISNGIAVMQAVYKEDGSVEDFLILLFNDYMLNWIGGIDYKGKRYSEVFPQTRQTGILNKFIAVAETTVPATFELVYDLESGKHWFRINALKQAELLVVTIEEITERKQTEIALKQALDAAEKQRRLYDSITNTTPDLVYVFDRDYRFAYANKALLAMWGKTAETAIGKGLRDNGYEEWHALMHEREIDEVLAEKKTIRGTVSFPHAELGRRVYDYIFGPVLNEKGEVEVIAGITRDITELKRAEESLQQSESRFRALVNASSDVVYRMNADWTVMRNLEGRGFLSDTGEPILNWMDKYIHPQDRERVTKAINEAISNKSIFELEHQVLTAEGTLGWTLSRAVPILDVQGDIIEWFGAASDITAQKTITEKLESLVAERTKELQRSNEDLQQFAHVASHDLKEPVRKIKTFTSRLEEHLDGKLDKTGAWFIERIQVATDRMFTMIDGVLTYSTINAGTQKLESVDLNEVVKNIETDLEVALQKTGGTIQYAELPTLEGAPVLLYQLFYNLINNSIKFARAGVPSQINLSSEIVVEPTESFARITLTDNGIGFEQDQTGRIFETFTRLNSKDQYEGTGLGLSLCKKIVERHGGNIFANGAPGQGATFIITLPLRQKEARI